MFGGLRLHGCRVSRIGQSADVGLGKAMTHEVAFRSRRRCTSRSQPLGVFKEGWLDRAVASSARPGGAVAGLFQAIQHFGVVFVVFSPIACGSRSDYVKLFLALAPWYPRFCVSQARVFVVLGVCPGTCVVPSRSVSSVLDTLTPVFEVYVRLRERRQRAATCFARGGVPCASTVVFVVPVVVGVEVELCSVEVVL
ncbi:hypothetical protein Taro_041705 [Colocasia esculenta]|uniref:Uncharacterized protein n=1 Tax=Colocasia esculenta TaxID=4460 RepID=A0A843WWL3_COLES|nr:hypothetical protein [Colocasia esculenta]